MGIVVFFPTRRVAHATCIPFISVTPKATFDPSGTLCSRPDD